MDNKNTFLYQFSQLITKNYSHQKWSMFKEQINRALKMNKLKKSDVLKLVDMIERLKQNESHLNFTSKTLDLIQQINIEISSLKPLNETLSISVEKLREVSRADIIFLFLPNVNETNHFTLKAVSGLAFETFKDFPLGIKDTLFEKIQHTQKPIVISDLSQTNEELDTFSKKLLNNHNIKSNIYSPILYNDQCIGFIILSRRVTYSSTNAHLKMLEVYCAHLSIALENTRLYHNELQISNIHRQVLDATFDKSYISIIKRLEDIINLPILLLDESGNSIFNSYMHLRQKPMVFLEKPTEIYNKIIRKKLHQEQQNFILKIDNSFSIVVFPIILENKNAGYLIMPDELDSNNPLDILTIEQFKNLIALKISEEKSLIEVELRLKQDYLYELLLGIENEENLYRRGRYLKFNFEKHYIIFVLKVDEKEIEQNSNILEEVKKTLELSVQQFSMIHDNKLVVICPEDSSSRFGQTLLKSYKALSIDATGFIGISNPVRTPAEYAKGYTEAKNAGHFALMFDMKQKIIHYDDLGIVGLFIQTNNLNEIQNFKEKYLHKLIDYDTRNNTNLVKTLKVYLNNESVLHASAQDLYIHYNTLRNRIKRIENILNLNLNTNELKLNLRIALVIHQLTDYQNV